MEKYMEPYAIEIVLASIIKLKLLESMRVHLLVNLSQVVRYREQVERQKLEKAKLIEVEKLRNR